MIKNKVCVYVYIEVQSNSFKNSLFKLEAYILISTCSSLGVECSGFPPPTRFTLKQHLGLYFNCTMFSKELYILG